MIDLKKFIEDNRVEFDNFQPGDRVWENISAGLSENENSSKSFHDRTVKKLIFYKWLAAASVVLLVAVSAFYFLKQPAAINQPGQENIAAAERKEMPAVKEPASTVKEEALPETENETFTAAADKKTGSDIKPATDVADEQVQNFKKSSAQFATVIEKQQASLKKLSAASPELYSQFMKDIKQLDENYKGLRKQLPGSSSKTELIRAMMYNLQIQLDILNKQLIILNKIESEQKKHSYEKDFLSA